MTRSPSGCRRHSTRCHRLAPTTPPAYRSRSHHRWNCWRGVRTPSRKRTRVEVSRTVFAALASKNTVQPAVSGTTTSSCPAYVVPQRGCAQELLCFRSCNPEACVRPHILPFMRSRTRLPPPCGSGGAALRQIYDIHRRGQQSDHCPLSKGCSHFIVCYGIPHLDFTVLKISILWASGMLPSYCSRPIYDDQCRTNR